MTPSASLPDPIYWKQNLFLIPYQWSTTADPGAARAVWLYVSKDHGATWHIISEAKPQVKAFNYHAECDGEYWFAIRTVDHSGQLQPAGPPSQPELRVSVDTTMPRIEFLATQFRSDGALEIQWRATDPNLDPNSWKFEVQLDATDSWYPVPFAGLRVVPLGAPPGPAAAGTHDGQTAWLPPPGTQPRALRATVYDRAGNSAAYGTGIIATTAVRVIETQQPPLLSASSPVARPAEHVEAAQNIAGWVSASDAPPQSAPASNESAIAQHWPATAISSAPFRLSAGASQTPGDGITSYGNPVGVGTVSTPGADVANDESIPPDPVNFGYASVNQFTKNDNGSDSSINGPTFATLEPFREPAESSKRPSPKRLPAVDGSPAAALSMGTEASESLHSQPAIAQLPAGVEPKLVGSRTFALEYELDDVGRRGVAKVELWGSRDGGQTWRSYAKDDDNCTPLVVTVDDEGLYGFRIVVEGAGSTVASPPCSGDLPELWVGVDLQQPVAELTSVEQGSGNMADHLLLRWRATDENLQLQPISLFYSSRPAGPWSVIATNLTNTGEYAWQMQRHVPERFYLRLEARDTAGNLAAFQTREPVMLPAAEPSGRLRGVEPIGPTAAGLEAEYR
jgi:hypothetical protein